jgi:hypothetical protein
VETAGISRHLAALEAKATGSRVALARARALNDELRARSVAAFQAPYEGVRQTLAEIDARAAQEPQLAGISPSLARINEARGEVVQARAELLALLRAR